MIGFCLIIFAFLGAIRKTIQLLKRELEVENKILIYVSIYIQLLFIIYGITGNTLYYWNQFFIYIIAISILNTVQFSKKSKLN